jgi:aspartyl/asparaginyl-tRNA synthetase
MLPPLHAFHTRYSANGLCRSVNRTLSTASGLKPTISQVIAKAEVGSAESVEVHGWVRSVRKQKRVAFAALSDGSHPAGIQAVFGDPALAKRYARALMRVLPSHPVIAV